MDDNAGDVGQLLADRYRLLLSPAEAEDTMQWRAYDTAAGQEVLVRQVPLPEVVEAELVDDELDGGTAADRGRGRGAATARRTGGRATRRPADPGVRRALEAALAASQLPDHPRLDQVFDVFVEGDGLWIVSELLPARPLASLLAERPLSPHRAAEIGADLLAALRAVHAQGWTHRNVTARTVLVCDDGHAMLTGLAAGAAEETLCGYDVLPREATEAAAADAPPPRGPDTDGGTPPQTAGTFGRPPAPRGLDSRAERGAEPDATAPANADGELTDSPGHFAGPPVAGRGGEPAGPAYGGEESPQAADSFGRPSGPRGADAQPPERAGGGDTPEGGFTGPRAAGPGQQPVGPAWDAEAHATDGTAWWQVAGAADSGAADMAERRDTAWWQTGPERGGPADAGPGRPVRGAPWGGDAHAYAGEPGAPEHGAAEHGPGRPDETDGPAARAARRGAIAAYHAGTRAASGHDAGRWPFDADEGAEEARPGSADIWADEDADDERWPFAPPRSSSAPPSPAGPGPAEPPAGKAEWWPFDEVPDGGAAAEPRPGPPHGQDKGQWWPFEDDAPDRRSGAAPTPPLPAGWEPAAAGAATPGTAARGSLGAERARDARLTVVGAVTERWAPEQAGGPQPVGPAADLWALGALLFRAVQGRAPYPEEAATELVESVRVGPPAAVEACGPLQPVVESLLRRNPAERSDERDLRDRLLAIVRSAPEPEAGRHTLVGPPSLEPGGPADPRRLPIVRRRGELVRRRRAAKRPRPVKPPKPARSAKRPKPAKPASLRKAPRPAPAPAPPPAAAPAVERQRPAASPTPPPRRPRRTGGSPRSLGRLLVGLVLLLLTGAVLYAMWFMPKQGGTGDDGLRQERGSVGGGPAPEQSSAAPSQAPSPANTPEPKVSRTQEVPSGFDLYDAPSGFRIAVPDGWHHSAVNGRGQVRFDKGDFEMVVVKGRDSTEKFGGDPMDYQSDDEPELKPYRTSDWATATGLRRIDVGGHAMAEGTFTWKDSSGRKVYVRNRALILDGRYHLVLVVGPADAREKIDRYFEGAVDTYRVLSR